MLEFKNEKSTYSIKFRYTSLKTYSFFLSILYKYYANLLLSLCFLRECSEFFIARHGDLNSLICLNYKT